MRNAPNAVLHPWLQAELTEILATRPAVTLPEAERPVTARWETWLGHVPREPLPPLRLILVWDNLAGHLSYAIVRWLFQHGVMPLYTPLSGSRLNMAEGWWRLAPEGAFAGQTFADGEEIDQVTILATRKLNHRAKPWIWGRPLRPHCYLRRRFVYRL